MQRLDLLLVERQLVSTRTQAQTLIRQGRVRGAYRGRWQLLCKPGLKLPEATPLEIESGSPALRFVSRAGLKLQALLQAIALNLEGQVILDIGQSTGGFTDCVLQAGAARVVGLDVGQKQLHTSLQEDARVSSLEKINARYLTPEQLQERQLPVIYDAIVMDVSFISQTLIWPQVSALLQPDGWLLSLVKPQFEVGQDKVGKGGVVRDAALYPGMEKKLRSQLQALGFEVKTWMPSPIKGGDGNQEFLLAAQPSSLPSLSSLSSPRKC